MLGMVMIVRNGAETLQRALNSANGNVDNLFVMMCGDSDDNTQAILAEAAKAMPLSWTLRPWGYDFSAARNASFDFARSFCTDWALLMDADDCLSGGPTVRQAVAQLEASHANVGMLRINFGNLTYWQNRLFDLRAAGQWKARVHETYKVENEHALQITTAEIVHQRGKKAGERNKDRNLEIFTKWYDEAPQEFDAHALFNFANERFWHRQWELAANTYRMSIDKQWWDDERYFSYIRMSQCYIAMEAWPLAFEQITEAIRLNPAWKDGYIMMSKWFYAQHIWDLAIATGELAETKIAAQTKLPVDSWLYAEVKNILGSARAHMT